MIRFIYNDKIRKSLCFGPDDRNPKLQLCYQISTNGYAEEGYRTFTSAKMRDIQELDLNFYYNNHEKLKGLIDDYRNNSLHIPVVRAIRKHYKCEQHATTSQATS